MEDPLQQTAQREVTWLKQPLTTRGQNGDATTAWQLGQVHRCVADVVMHRACTPHSEGARLGWIDARGG
jgi:hypothetical protein